MSNSIIMARNPDDGEFIYVNCDTNGKLNVNLEGETINIGDVHVSNADYAKEATLQDIDSSCTAINSKLDGEIDVNVKNTVTVKQSPKHGVGEYFVLDNTLSAGSSSIKYSIPYYGKNTILSYTDTNIANSNSIMVFGQTGSLESGFIVLLGVLQPIRYGEETKRYATCMLNLEAVDYIYLYNPLGSATVNNVWASVLGSVYD